MAMRKIALACLVVTGEGRRVWSSFQQAHTSPYERSQAQEESLARLLLVSSPAASFAHSSPTGRFATSSTSAISSPRVMHNVRMEEEPSGQAVTIGAAALGGALGVQFTGELLPSVIISLVFAYLSTLSNGLGDVTKSAGGLAAKAYKKTLDINEEYEVLPKIKGATDSVVTVADNLNKNYGVTDQAAKYLKIEQVTEKIDSIKSDVGSKIDDLKSAASEK